MITYQDYLTSENKEKFIIDSIGKFKTSPFYDLAVKSRRYYNGDNDILDRLKWFWGSVTDNQGDNIATREVDKFKANNTVSNNFYKKIVLQEKSYLLSNGVQVEEKYKNTIKKLDRNINEATLSALLDGKSYIYCSSAKGGFSLKCFTGLEFIPLYDERNGMLVAGIRFYRLDENRPYYIEFYELNGVTEFILKDNKLTIITPKKGYETVNKSDILGVKKISKNWSRLPIVEVKADNIGIPRLTTSLKSKMDLYDIILSDFGNNLEDSQDVYWVLKNYGGTSIEEFLTEYNHYKTIKVDDQGDATPNTIDVPYQARETALNLLKAKIYEESMAVDMSVINGSGVTNEHIKSAFADLDLKVDSLEEQLKDAIDNIIELFEEYKIGIGAEVEVETDISFVRNTLMNETQTIENIMNLMSLGLLSKETAMRWNPYVDDEEKELQLIEEENNTLFKEGIKKEEK